MLTHIVCWKYKVEIGEDSRNAHRVKLRKLKDLIEDVHSLDVGADVLRLERSFDTGLVATFADCEALERYTLHADHKKVVAFGRKIAETVVSVDFMAPPEN